MSVQEDPSLRLWQVRKETRLDLLAVRFWDPVMERPVTDRLTVTARPLARDGPLLRAVPGESLYIFHKPPAMTVREEEAEPYQIEVWDHAGRFLPVSLTLPLPYPRPRVFPPTGESSRSPPGLYLFAAPTRSGGPGLSVIRAELWNAATGRPAPHAVLEVQEGPRLWHGVADHRGCVAVLIRCPVVRERPRDEGPPLALDQVQFPITVRVRCQATPPAPSGRGRLPELRSILSQPAGLLRPSGSGPFQAEWPLPLPYSQEITLRTEAPPTRPDRTDPTDSVLWIEPAHAR